MPQGDFRFIRKGPEMGPTLCTNYSVATEYPWAVVHLTCSRNKRVAHFLSVSAFIYERAAMFVVCTHALSASIHNSPPKSHGLLLHKFRVVLR